MGGVGDNGKSRLIYACLYSSNSKILNISSAIKKKIPSNKKRLPKGQTSKNNES